MSKNPETICGFPIVVTEGVPSRSLILCTPRYTEEGWFDPTATARASAIARNIDEIRARIRELESK